jgi:hypothetical protein
MELSVMTILNWRLRSVTPFDFLDYFISKLPSSSSSTPSPELFNRVFYASSDLILSTTRGNPNPNPHPSPFSSGILFLFFLQNISYNIANSLNFTDLYFSDRFLGFRAIDSSSSGRALCHC